MVCYIEVPFKAGLTAIGENAFVLYVFSVHEMLYNDGLRAFFYIFIVVLSI